MNLVKLLFVKLIFFNKSVELEELLSTHKTIFVASSEEESFIKLIKTDDFAIAKVFATCSTDNQALETDS